MDYNISNRPSFIHQSEYCSLITPLTKKLDINCFNHMRVLSTGYIATLSTNPYMIADLHANNYPFPLMSKNGQIAPSGSYYYSTFTHPMFQGGWNMLANKYAFANILFMVQNYGDYADIFMMGSDPDNNNVVSNYLNYQNDLQKFLNVYMPQSQQLLHQELALAIDLSPCLEESLTIPLMRNNASTTTKDFLANTKNITLRCHTTRYYITQRELQCLYYLAHGDSYKSIGNKLNISPRTVEAHIEHLKNKTGSSTRRELIHLFWESEVEAG